MLFVLSDAVDLVLLFAAGAAFVSLLLVGFCCDVGDNDDTAAKRIEKERA